MSLNTAQLAEDLDEYAKSIGRSGGVIDDHWKDVIRQWNGLVDRLDADWVRDIQPVFEKTGEFFNEYTDMTKRLENHLQQSAEKLRRFHAQEK